MLLVGSDICGRGSLIWEETEAPRGNPHIQVGDHITTLIYNHCKSRGSNSGRNGDPLFCFNVKLYIILQRFTNTFNNLYSGFSSAVYKFMIDRLIESSLMITIKCLFVVFNYFSAFIVSFTQFWDIKNSRQCKGSLSPGSPVWRARYTVSPQEHSTLVQKTDS